MVGALSIFSLKAFAGAFYNLDLSNKGEVTVYKATTEDQLVTALLKIKLFRSSSPQCASYGGLKVTEKSINYSSDGQTVVIVLSVSGWYKFKSSDYLLVSYDAGSSWTLENALEGPAGGLSDCDWIDTGNIPSRPSRKARVQASQVIMKSDRLFVPVNADTVTNFVGCCGQAADNHNKPKPDNLVFEMTQGQNPQSACPTNIITIGNVSCSSGSSVKKLVYKSEFQTTDEISWLQSIRLMEYVSETKLELTKIKYNLATPRGEGLLVKEINNWLD